MERLGLGLPLTFKWDGLASQTSAYLYLDVPNTILWSTHVLKYVRIVLLLQPSPPSKGKEGAEHEGTGLVNTVHACGC